MASAGEIKERMQSIAETKKVTDAMHRIASVKMRRAKREHRHSERYYEALERQIASLLRYIPSTETSRYFHTPLPEGKSHWRHGILLVTSDKGLAGAYNQTALKLAEQYMGRHPETVLFIVGEYGRQYFQSRNIPFVEDFHYPAAFPSVWEAQQMCAELLAYYESGRVDEINLIYTDYMGAKPSVCRRQVLLPLDKSVFYRKEETEQPYREFSPDAQTVLGGIVPSYLAGFIYTSLVDSYCSEQQSRMLAMSTASNNAEEMLKKLTSQYNALRQASITNEMIEITAGAKALRTTKRTREGRQ